MVRLLKKIYIYILFLQDKDSRACVRKAYFSFLEEPKMTRRRWYGGKAAGLTPRLLPSGIL